MPEIFTDMWECTVVFFSVLDAL